MTTTKQHLARLDERLSRVEEDVTGLKRDVTGLKHDVTGLKEQFSEFREENRREHNALYATLREEMYILADKTRREISVELTSHIGALQEHLDGQFQLLFEAQRP